jgi:hypothetical protein
VCLMLIQIVECVGCSHQGLLAAISLAQQLARLPTSSSLLVLTDSSASTNPFSPALISLEGTIPALMRVLRLELDLVEARCVDVARGYQQWVSLHTAVSEAHSAFATAHSEGETAHCNGTRFVLRLRRSRRVTSTTSLASSGGSWLITGGLGGLGMRAAALLKPTQQLTIISRHGRVAHDVKRSL